jgi:hypothetical protein
MRAYAGVSSILMSIAVETASFPRSQLGYEFFWIARRAMDSDINASAI